MSSIIFRYSELHFNYPLYYYNKLLIYYKNELYLGDNIQGISFLFLMPFCNKLLHYHVLQCHCSNLLFYYKK